MKRIFICLIFFVLLISCSSSKDVERKSVLADNEVYETYNISKDVSVLHVPRIDDYDKLKDYVVIVNNSSTDIEELTLACFGTKRTRSANWRAFVGPYDNIDVQNVDTPIVFAECFERIPAGKKRKLALDRGVQIRDMRYVLLSAETSIPVVVSDAKEKKHDLYLYIVDKE